MPSAFRSFLGVPWRPRIFLRVAFKSFIRVSSFQAAFSGLSISLADNTDNIEDINPRRVVYFFRQEIAIFLLKEH